MVLIKSSIYCHFPEPTAFEPMLKTLTIWSRKSFLFVQNLVYVMIHELQAMEYYQFI